MSSNDQCYNSDDQWWELQDVQYEQMLHDYPKIVPPPESEPDNAKLATRTAASQLCPDTSRSTQCYPISSATSVSTKPPTQAAASPTRPKRRRGRGGAVAATTFLNSSITNFRQLVQQHTGMGTTAATTATTSYYYASCNQKGPITLCFGNYSSSSSTSESAPGINHGSR